MADVKMIKVHAANQTNGPKVLNASPIVTLQAGQSTDGEIEISEAELAAAKKTDWFKFGAPPKPEVKPAA